MKKIIAVIITAVWFVNPVYSALSNTTLTLGHSLVMSSKELPESQREMESWVNWPVQLGFSQLVFSAAVFGDIDGDKDLEVVAPVFCYDTEWSWAEGIYAFHHDGSVIDLDGDPNKISPLIHLTFCHAFQCQPVTLANLDEDNALEIIYKGTDESGLGIVGAYNGDGSLVNGWPYVRAETNFLDFNYASTVAADMTCDGEYELIFADQYSSSDEKTHLYVVDNMGNDLPGFPIELLRNDFGIGIWQIAVGNITGDEKLEIIVSSAPGAAQGPNSITVIDIQGNIIWSHKFPALDFILGDVDSNGNLEVVAIEMPRRRTNSQLDSLVSQLVVWDSKGLVKHKTDILLGDFVSEYYFDNSTMEHVFVKSIAYFSSRLFSWDILLPGDLNLDGELEAVFSTRYSVVEERFSSPPGRIVVIEDKGTIEAITLSTNVSLFSFPIEIDYSHPASELSPPIVAERLADVTNDGEADIIATKKSGYNVNILFWNSTGIQLSGINVTSQTHGLLNRVTEHMTTTIGDIDQNGKIDISVPLIGGELHMVELETSYSKSYLTWSTYRGDIQQTGMVSKNFNLNIRPYVLDIFGPSYGKPGIEYSFSIVVIDPDNDKIFCFWNWGDGNNSGWIGPYMSGGITTASYTWINQGNYEIKVKARDIYSAESEWSELFNINLPRKKNHLFQTNRWINK